MSSDVRLYAVRMQFGQHGAAQAGTRPDDLALPCRRGPRSERRRRCRRCLDTSDERRGETAVCIGLGQRLAVVLEKVRG